MSLTDHTQIPKSGISAVEQIVDLAAFEVAEGFGDVLFEAVSGGVGVAVVSAEGFGDDVIDHVELLEMLAGELEAFGQLGGAFVAFEQDGGAGFRADDAVPGVLEHGDAVGHTDAECATGTAFTDDDGDDLGFQPAHFEEVSGDGFSLAAFFGTDTGGCAGGVDEADDGEVEFLGQFHAAEGFAIAFGLGETEVAFDAFGGVSAFVVTDEHDFVFTDAGHAADNGLVVTEAAVAMNFAEFLTRADGFEIIAEQRPLGMPGNLDGFPGGEVVVGFAEQGGVVEAKLLKLGGVVNAFAGLDGLEIFDLLFEAGEGFFKFQSVSERLTGVGTVGSRGRAHPDSLDLTMGRGTFDGSCSCQRRDRVRLWGGIFKGK